MPQTSTSRARWTGSLNKGSGVVSTSSDAVKEAPLGWRARTGDDSQGDATTPEELLAAGWASCFSMAFAGGLGKAGHEAASLDVVVDMTFGAKDGGGFGIHGAVIKVDGDVPGIEMAEFEQLADEAKDGCPVSQAFKGNVPVELEARLAGRV